MAEYTIALEPWSEALWAEMEPLANAHFNEVDGGIEPNRPFRLDLRLMRAIADAGMLKMIVPRLNGRLIGYFTWNVTLDVESEGLLIAQQGAWYVEPGHHGVAVRTFEAAVAELKAMGVKCIFPHHRTQGRGAGIGRFFKRRGAKDIQRTYSLWIGD